MNNTSKIESMTEEEMAREYARAQAKRKEVEAGQAAAKALADLVNAFAFEGVEAFVAEITCRTHRTLQQGVGRVVFALLRGWATNHREGNCDLRNEAICGLSVKILDMLEKAEITYKGQPPLPLI